MTHFRPASDPEDAIHHSGLPPGVTGKGEGNMQVPCKSHNIHYL